MKCHGFVRHVCKYGVDLVSQGQVWVWVWLRETRHARSTADRSDPTNNNTCRLLVAVIICMYCTCMYIHVHDARVA